MFVRELSMLHRRDARSVYVAENAAYTFCFTLIVSVNLVYQATTVGLSAFQLVLVGTVLEAVCFSFEVPTGVVADVYSRRLSVIIGIALIGAGFALEGSIPELWAVLAGNVLFGIGATFTSGAEQAWVNDELGEAGAAGAMVRGAQAASVAGFVAIPLSVGLAQVTDLQVPIVAGGLGLVALAAVLAVAMPEDGFAPLPPGQRSSWEAMAGTFKGGLAQVRMRPALRRVILLGLVFGAFTEGFDRLSVAHMIRDIGVPQVGGLGPQVWLGGLMMIEGLIVMVVLGRIGGRLESEGAENAVPLLGLTYRVAAVGAIAFALLRGFGPAAAAVVSTSTARGLAVVLYQIVLNAGLDARSRATVNSFAAQSDALGQIGGGLVIGALAGTVSITAALLFSAALLFLAPAVLRGRRGEVEEGAGEKLGCRGPGAPTETSATPSGANLR
jgi:MFS transporter, DHA3 family, tetracycline resistance protein